MADRKPSCQWVLLARACTEYDSTPTIHGIFSGVELEQVPSRLPPFVIVSRWRGPRGQQADYLLRVTGPRDFHQETEAVVQFGADGSMYSYIIADSFEVPAYGDYLLEIVFDGVSQQSELLAVLPRI